jgi:outer membrane protein TolC
MNYQCWLQRVLIPLTLTVCLASNWTLAQKPVVQVGVVLDGPSSFSDEAAETFEREISIILADEYDIRFPAAKKMMADWTLSGVEAAVDRLLTDGEVDIVLTLGFISSHVVARRTSLSRPVFAPYVGETSFQGIPRELRNRPLPPPDRGEEYYVSGVKNLSYLEFGGNLGTEVGRLRKVVPFSRLAILLLSSWAESIPDRDRVAREALAGLSLERVDTISIETSAQGILADIPADADAIYLPPIPAVSEAEKVRLFEGLKSRGLPSFSSWGRSDVELGVMVGFRTEDRTLRRARRTGMLMQEVLEGGEAGEMPVQFEFEGRLTINMETARAVGVSPRFTTLISADLLNEELTRAARTLSLSQVVREASIANLDLAAADRFVAAGQDRVGEARSPLLPQVGLSGDITFRDKKVADLLPELFGKREYNGGINIRQSIYSDKNWAAFDIERSLQDRRQEERAELRLDVILEAAESYLQLLRFKTIEQVQKENLDLTRANLDLAQSRVEIGAAGREELFRWQDQVATNQRDVVEAEALSNQAALAVNRVLNRPLDEQFLTTEATLSDPELVASFETLTPFLDTPAGLRLFSNFMVDEAYQASPELRQLEASLRAQQREVDAAKRSFFIPDVFLQGGWQWFDRGGEGIPGLPDINNTWAFSIGATIPLFEGAGRWARVSRTENQLDELKLRREATRQRVEERVRSLLQAANSSFIGITLVNASAEAASRNLELVTDSYAQGVVGILALLDAQNRALAARLAAANAGYGYLIDLMRVQRAVGNFDYYRSPQERQEFLSRLQAFYKDRGFQLRTP